MNKPAERRINWTNVSTVVSAAVLIGAEVFGMAYAGGWALAILMGLDNVGAYVLQALFCAGGLFVMWKFVVGASRIEPFTTR
jgi:hypothetical protein